jgi:hypothetical protein
MKKIDWTPILVPFIFAAAIAGCAMMVGSLMAEKEGSLLDPMDATQVSQAP